MKNPVNLRSKRRKITCVLYHIIGSGPLLVKGKLARFTPIQLRFRPPAMRSHPGQTHLARGIDENHRITFLIKPSLEKQRRIDDQGNSRTSRSRELFRPFRFDPRVRQTFQTSPLRRVMKHDLRDLAAINLARVIQHTVAPPRHDLAHDVRVSQRLAPESVGITDDATKLRKNLRNGALTRTDPADEPDDWNPPIAHAGMVSPCDPVENYNCFAASDSTLA